MAEDYLETYRNFKEENLKDKITLIPEIQMLFRYMYGPDEFEKFNQKYFDMSPLIQVKDLINQSSSKVADALEDRFSNPDTYVYQDDDGEVTELSDNYLNLLELAFIKYEQNSAQDSFNYFEMSEILEYRKNSDDDIYDNKNVEELANFIDQHPNDNFKLTSADTGKPITNLRLAQTQVDKLSIELA